MVLSYKNRGVDKPKKLKGIIMSISVAIGSDYQDIKNIQDTITILNFVRNLVSNKSLHIANDSASAPDIDLDYDYVDNILDWYTGIYQILVDVSVFADTSPDA